MPTHTDIIDKFLAGGGKSEDLEKCSGKGCGGMKGCTDRTYEPDMATCQECLKDAHEAIAQAQAEATAEAWARARARASS